MGHRTLSLELVLRALFLDSDAYDALRDDDNPFIEGAFLIVLIGAVTALLSFIGQLLMWASSPNLDEIKRVVLQGLQQMTWWPLVAANPESIAQFQRIWDGIWSAAPVLFGAPNPTTALLNVVAWPVQGLLSWFIYGTLAHLFGRLLHGQGTYRETLGTMALSATPLLLRGLGFIPFLVLGSVLSTWQLLCRYRAVRSAQRLGVARAVWATILPFAVYLVLWILLVLFAVWLIGSFVGG